jgi:hypothetical protein
MERIGDDVRLALRRFGRVEGMDELLVAWPTAVGDAVARNAWPARLARDGTLYVATSSSAWAFELTHLEEEIRKRLFVALGTPPPKRLRFAPGRLAERGRDDASVTTKERPTPGAEERARAARIASTIVDDELRDLVGRAVAASLASAGSGRRL